MLVKVAVSARAWRLFPFRRKMLDVISGPQLNCLQWVYEVA